MLRTHTCGGLGAKDIDKEVKLSGWVHSRRDHGGLIFIDLRDRYGLMQIVFDPKNKEDFSAAEKLRREDVISVDGKVVARKQGMENPKMKTGKIEVEVSKLDVLNKAETPPIEVDDRKEAGEDIRLQYRYLDLRRPVMQKRLMIRHKAAEATREFLNNEKFMEIETPLLIRATPEGARDYIVPSRVNPGKFYSLPQSPQLYKQILMVSGMDRYYQLARCLRDEDLRQDRQPEFTQIDIEMSFIDEEDIYKLGEGLIRAIWKKAIDVELKTPFPRFTYEEAMNRYGSDKPDLRFGLELIDVSDVVKKGEFGVFKDAESVKCLAPEKDFSRKELDEYISFCQEVGAKGMAWMKVTDKGLESNIVKFFSEAIQKELLEATKAKPGSVLMFIADKANTVNYVLGELRLKLRDDLKLAKEEEFKFCWITDFPLFEWDEDNGRWSPMHHIFSMPKEDKVKFLEKEPGKVTGKLYDLALNGVELGGGSIRIHRKELQEKVLKVIGMTYAEAEERFGFLLNSFKYGAPPHGGIAFGFDRICALLNGINDIREVMAFPKNKAAECPMDGSPSGVEEQQLKELHIKTELVKKK
ncbi:aspartate--tRNA ligase [Candidatus Woesearchaeota archaeon]|nr:aspartate--tRNA ligase [Candidatus Woesearchaeota archaeon]